jgi:hypothetical protein
MNIFVVMKRPSHLAILKALLPPEVLGACDFVVTDPRSSFASVARTLLVKHHRPLAAVIDTESLEPSVIHDVVATTEQLLRMVAGATPFRVISCTPALEAVFFEGHLNLKKIFPHAEQQFLMFAKTSPKEALNFLFENGGGPKNLSEFLDRLLPEDIAKLQATYPIQHLVSFISEVCQTVGT